MGKYDSPEELLHDDTVSHAERIRMLEQWRDDEKAIIQASDEGMGSGGPPDILKRVKKALISLRATASKG